MNIDNQVEIEADAAAVWPVFTDVARWPEWTASVIEATGLDSPDVDVGNRFAIRQPRLPRLVWEVTEVSPGRSWAWRNHSFAAVSIATHELVPSAPGRTLVHQRLQLRGPLGVLTAVLRRRLMRRYLALESAGLKRRVEQLPGPSAATA
jgi:uncharacterized membrane protein